MHECPPQPSRLGRSGRSFSGGAVASNARQLFDIVKSLSGDTVELEKQENNWVELRSGASRFGARREMIDDEADSR